MSIAGIETRRNSHTFQVTVLRNMPMTVKVEKTLSTGGANDQALHNPALENNIPIPAIASNFMHNSLCII